MNLCEKRCVCPGIFSKKDAGIAKRIIKTIRNGVEEAA